MTKKDFKFLEQHAEEYKTIVHNQSAFYFDLNLKQKTWEILEREKEVTGLCPKCPSSVVSLCQRAYNLYVNNKSKFIKDANTDK